jgi:hypothetical protein
MTDGEKAMEKPRAEEIYLRYISDLPFAVRAELLAIIADDLAAQAEEMGEPPELNILDLEGMGAEVWAGIDAQEYVNALRDGRPLPGESDEAMQSGT